MYEQLNFVFETSHNIPPWFHINTVWPDSAKLLDLECFNIVQNNQNMLIPWYLMSSYGYYHRDVSLISDSLFDQICCSIDHHYSEIEHRHKCLVSASQTKATAHSLVEDAYPMIIKSTARYLIDQYSCSRNV